jgi:hypothetical protein
MLWPPHFAALRCPSMATCPLSPSPFAASTGIRAGGRFTLDCGPYESAPIIGRLGPLLPWHRVAPPRTWEQLSPLESQAGPPGISPAPLGHCYGAAWNSLASAFCGSPLSRWATRATPSLSVATQHRIRAGGSFTLDCGPNASAFIIGLVGLPPLLSHGMPLGDRVECRSALARCDGSPGTAVTSPLAGRRILRDPWLSPRT